MLMNRVKRSIGGSQTVTKTNLWAALRDKFVDLLATLVVLMLGCFGICLRLTRFRANSNKTKLATVQEYSTSVELPDWPFLVQRFCMRLFRLPLPA